MRLIMEPLSYLGFEIEDQASLETILANSYYYPGILQLFGHNIVSMLPALYNGTYSAKGNPPFTLGEAQLSSIMEDSEIRDGIKKRFNMTLDLDPRYRGLALVVAYLTYEEMEGDGLSSKGFEADEVFDYALEFEIPELASEDLGTTVMLLDEMCAMGVLTELDDGQPKYRIRRHRFLSYLGTKEQVYAKIDDYLDSEGL